MSQMPNSMNPLAQALAGGQQQTAPAPQPAKPYQPGLMDKLLTNVGLGKFFGVPSYDPYPSQLPNPKNYLPSGSGF